jgi:hypothetical protein
MLDASFLYWALMVPSLVFFLRFQRRSAAAVAEAAVASHLNSYTNLPLALEVPSVQAPKVLVINPPTVLSLQLVTVDATVAAVPVVVQSVTPVAAVGLTGAVSFSVCAVHVDALARK